MTSFCHAERSEASMLYGFLTGIRNDRKNARHDILALVNAERSEASMHWIPRMRSE